MIETTHIHGWKLYHYQKSDAPDIMSIRLLFPNYNTDQQIGLPHLYNRLLLTQLQEASSVEEVVCKFVTDFIDGYRLSDAGEIE